jgi:hypothetical protein
VLVQEQGMGINPAVAAAAAVVVGQQLLLVEVYMEM